MGSLTSRPKVPALSTAATTTVIATPQINQSGNTDGESTDLSPEQILQNRAENILRRSRSSLGTVLTSFRGILSENSSAPQRKSLLGE
jgi:hypothetical protein